MNLDDDEKWFYQTTAIVELAATPAVSAIKHLCEGAIPLDPHGTFF